VEARVNKLVNGTIIKTVEARGESSMGARAPVPQLTPLEPPPPHPHSFEILDLPLVEAEKM
jgi:hypothetical protein